MKLVEIENGEEIGQIVIRKNRNGDYYLTDFYVKPRHRRKGIGGSLLTRALAWAKREGVKELSLRASPYGKRYKIPKDRLVNLYLRFGFRYIIDAKLEKMIKVYSHERKKDEVSKEHRRGG